jgi:hypothetical protein
METTDRNEKPTRLFVDRDDVPVTKTKRPGRSFSRRRNASASRSLSDLSDERRRAAASTKPKRDGLREGQPSRGEKHPSSRSIPRNGMTAYSAYYPANRFSCLYRDPDGRKEAGRVALRKAYWDGDLVSHDRTVPRSVGHSPASMFGHSRSSSLGKGSTGCRWYFFIPAGVDSDLPSVNFHAHLP